LVAFDASYIVIEERVQWQEGSPRYHKKLVPESALDLWRYWQSTNVFRTIRSVRRGYHCLCFISQPPLQVEALKGIAPSKKLSPIGTSLNARIFLNHCYFSHH
jgi:hypothetical protein